MRNDFKPGDALLSEPELSLQFKVSRPVLREALKMLGAKGLIESRPKTGTRVRPRADWNLLDPDVISWQYKIEPTNSFLQTTCEVRLVFKPMTTRLAAEVSLRKLLILATEDNHCSLDGNDVRKGRS
jgi:DNA-binding FadR family transcriptional regulator